MQVSKHEMQVIEPGSVSEWVWQNKYRFTTDKTPGDTARRVARELASCEKDPAKWEAEFYDVLSTFEFLPAGRIIAGAGTGRAVTFSNCFVMGTIDDSLAGIMKAVGDAAMTMKAGGGVGMDFSTLRPRGAIVKGVDSVSSGAVSFMDLWNTMCGTIMSAGARRGAMMGTLRCDHPDIEEFITAKRTPGRLTNFNVSVLVTDAFMDAVKHSRQWALHFGGKEYRTVNARDLWEQIARLTYEHAEPGVIFIDRINATNPLHYCETIASTNPCAEQPLPPYGACLLGSINLTQFVRHPFSGGSGIDSASLSAVVRTAIRMMDNVNDVSAYPLEQQRHEAQQKRRIGLGVTGLADTLIMMGMRYGSDRAARFTSRLMNSIASAAASESEDLGEEKGSFPLFDAEKFPGTAVARRNSHLTSIAPTGTISLLAGNVSSGIEPVFAFEYTRRLLQPDGSHKEVRVEDYVVRLAKSMGVPTSGPEWVTTDDLTVDDHLAMVAAIQPWVDSSISKTINCPADMPFDEFAAVYTKAYDLGLKGCTTYRPSGTRGAVLVKDAPAPAVEQIADSNVVQIGEPLARDEVLRGRTYKIPPGGGLEHGIYITINDIVQHGRRRPFEIFVNTKAVDSYSWIIALTRMISAVWRKGGDVAFVAEELRQVFDPRGGFWMQGKQVASVCAAIGQIIERHMRETGHLSETEAAPTAARVLHCPKCQTGALHAAEGCMSCDSCDYSKCG